MAKSKLEHHFHTATFLVVATIAAALVLALLWPWLNNARHRYLAHQITRAQQLQRAGDWQQAVADLQRANWLSFGDGAVPTALGQIYQAVGEYPAAIAAYRQLSFRQRYSLIGQAALTSQDYGLAEKTYAQAVAEQPTADNFDWLAVAQFNLGQTANGCSNVDKAQKLELDNTQAQVLGAACLIIEDKGSQALTAYPQLAARFRASDRQADYFLIQSGVVRVGEQRLEQLSNKSVQDWLVLAQIAAQRADLNTAASRAQAGLKLDPTNNVLNQFLTQIERSRGDKSQVEYYQNRLRDLFAN